MESRVVDLDLACLICLNEEPGHSSIYSHDLEPPHTLIADKIRCCTTLQLESLQIQRWPDKICEQCHSELGVAYRFYEKCVLIEKLFLTATSSALLVDVDELAKNQQLKLDLEQHHVKLPSSLKIKRIEVDADIPLASRTVRPYPCEVCQKAFISNVELRRHMRVHTGQKPYGCRYCDRRFSDFGSSKKHERIHTGERPYVCEVCHKGFAYAHVLSVHRRTHTGKKQFQCTQCDKGFTKKSYLAAHMDQHNGVTAAAPAVKRPAATRKVQKRHAVPETLSIGHLMLGEPAPKVLEECIVTHDFMFNEEDECDADDHDMEAAEEEDLELDDPDQDPEHDDFDDVYHQGVRSVPYALVGNLLDSEEFADDSKYLID
ncbi:GL16446 [Drosophila persimilis]|uniref:GL16446 n=1 Tax=Drosophila persimilis TaxID=7234 RepID=B4GWG7_DROPE|nr:GL16446 [Drosophila persimilis]